MEEIWKDIEGFKGYKVSTLGRVKSPDLYVEAKDKFVLYKKGKILKPYRHKKNRLYVGRNY